jgi:signal transduction histidine kinase
VVVVTWNGEVLGVEPGGQDWIGREGDALLHERAELPAPLRQAALEAIGAARPSGVLVKREIEVPELDAMIELIVVPGVGLRLAEIDVRTLLHQAILPLERQARAADVGVRLTIDAGVPDSVRLDPEKIGWAVAALAGNAMRYVKRGTRQMPGGTIDVRASAAQPGELAIQVEDDGPGIPAEVLARLFRREAGRGPAPGLGLSLARDIAAAHGGSLDVASSTNDTDHGTTVRLRIPF